MSRDLAIALALLLGAGAAPSALAGHAHDQPADADSACTPAHAAMGHCAPPDAAAAPSDRGTERASGCSPEHAAMGHCTPRSVAGTPTERDTESGPGCTPEHPAMGHCTPAPVGTQPPREPIPPLTDADRAAAFPALSHAGMAHGPERYGVVRFNRLEAWDADHGAGQAWEGSASFGGDLQRLHLRSHGEREGGRTKSSDVEVSVSHAITPWWDAVVGVRHDFRPAASQSRATVGVRGLAPYLFEVSAMAYIGASGRVSAKLEAEYELLLSNRLILQPLLEIELHGKDDPRRGTGSGLSKAEAGLRLRYEVTRRFAPYVGVTHERSFGGTADAHVAEGESSRDTRVVAGVRFWF